MLDLADILRAAAPAYFAAHGEAISPSQRRAINDIVRCRTAALGGHVYQCDSCGALDYAYHSCRNRHCPKCQGEREQKWLSGVRARMLPCDHYLLTFTLPEELRAVARANPEIVYSILLQESAATMQKLALDPAWVGGQPGILAVLHTWTRTLDYHPHVHLLVTAGGMTRDGSWIKPAHSKFLMPGRMLSDIFRAKMRDAFAKVFAKADLTPNNSDIDPAVWNRTWNVHVEQIGRGDHALRYLARYGFHVAISNGRLLAFQGGKVTFGYTHGRTREERSLTLPVNGFIGRFLQHVLPSGFTKIRYYGLLSPSSHEKLKIARTILELHATSESAPTKDIASVPAASLPADDAPPDPAPERRCTVCHRGHLALVDVVVQTRGPP
jgi:hypothetical protein